MYDDIFHFLSDIMTLSKNNGVVDIVIMETDADVVKCC